MSILVTGGKGFIGARLVRELVRRGEEVVCLDLRATPGRLADLADRVKFVDGDISDRSAIDRVLADHPISRIAHMVFYLAEERGVSSRPEDPEGLYRQEMIMNTGTFHVFEAARQAGIRRVIYPSSVQYHAGDEPWGGPEPVTEDSPARPTSLYGIGKLLCERLAGEYNRLHGTEYITLRIPGAYGPGAAIGARGINLVATRGAVGQPIQLPYSPDQRVVLAHVDDIAFAFAQALDLPRMLHPVYHIGGHDVSFADIAAIGRQITPGLDVTFNEGAPLRGSYRIDSSLASRELGLRHRALIEGYCALARETLGAQETGATA